MKKALLPIFLLALACATPALADDAAPVANRHLLVQPRNADGSLVLPRFQDDPVLWIRDEQQNFYGAMSRAMKDMGGGTTEGGALSLMLLSLGYGVFHAAGPGHGKAVISGWLLATETQLRRGILVAFISAMIQALVAIALVSGALLLVSGAASAAKDMAGWLETASFAMIGALGAYLLWTGLVALRGGGHHHHGAAEPAHRFEITNPLPAADKAHVHGPDCDHDHHDHDHHDHGHHDHAHAPTAADVAGDWSGAKAFSLALAVGLRPCTGAILVLLFAYNLGIYWAGVASTFVMGLGTFATVSLIATIAVYSKQLATRLAGEESRWLTWLNLALRLGGGLAILVFGATLAYASYLGGLADGGF